LKKQWSSITDTERVELSDLLDETDIAFQEFLHQKLEAREVLVQELCKFSILESGLQKRLEFTCTAQRKDISTQTVDWQRALADVLWVLRPASRAAVMPSDITRAERLVSSGYASRASLAEELQRQLNQVESAVTALRSAGITAAAADSVTPQPPPPPPPQPQQQQQQQHHSQQHTPSHSFQTPHPVLVSPAPGATPEPNVYEQLPPPEGRRAQRPAPAARLVSPFRSRTPVGARLHSSQTAASAARQEPPGRAQSLPRGRPAAPRENPGRRPPSRSSTPTHDAAPSRSSTPTHGAERSYHMPHPPARARSPAMTVAFGRSMPLVRPPSPSYSAALGPPVTASQRLLSLALPRTTAAASHHSPPRRHTRTPDRPEGTGLRAALERYELHATAEEAALTDTMSWIDAKIDRLRSMARGIVDDASPLGVGHSVRRSSRGVDSGDDDDDDGYTVDMRPRHGTAVHVHIGPPESGTPPGRTDAAAAAAAATVSLGVRWPGGMPLDLTDQSGLQAALAASFRDTVLRSSSPGAAARRTASPQRTEAATPSRGRETGALDALLGRMPGSATSASERLAMVRSSTPALALPVPSAVATPSVAAAVALSRSGVTEPEAGTASLTVAALSSLRQRIDELSTSPSRL
jgi:hypothetical protein